MLGVVADMQVGVWYGGAKGQRLLRMLLKEYTGVMFLRVDMIVARG